MPGREAMACHVFTQSDWAPLMRLGNALSEPDKPWLAAAPLGQVAETSGRSRAYNPAIIAVPTREPKVFRRHLPVVNRLRAGLIPSVNRRD